VYPPPLCLCCFLHFGRHTVPPLCFFCFLHFLDTLLLLRLALLCTLTVAGCPLLTPGPPADRGAPLTRC
jgi:hypothetical protein